jgi:putative hydrolase of the HAD superfamily
MPNNIPPKGLLLDYGGTLVEEVRSDARAGNEALLARALYKPPHITIDQIMTRANRISMEVAARRDEFHLETPWPTLTRLIHDYLGIRFAEPMADLELAFWSASVTTTPMPGAREALEQFHRCGLPIAVVSNCAFGQDVLRYELGKHGLADRLEFIVVSAEYSVRKPNPLLFDTAAARLGVAPKDIWFVGDRLDTDVTGAQAAGMQAVWFQPGKNSESSPDASVVRVESWNDLLHRFENLHAGAGAGGNELGAPLPS